MTPMHKKLFLVGLFISSLLSACSSTSQGQTLPLYGTPIAIPSAFIPSCTAIQSAPTPSPQEASLFPPVSESDWVEGPAEAAVTIIEYTDFQCPQCSTLAPVLAQLTSEHPEDVRIVFRHFPLMSVYDKSALAAQAAEAAGKQGQFWEMHDLLFAQQGEWNALSPEDFKQWLSAQVVLLGLDAGRFNTDLTDEDIITRIQKAWEDGKKTILPGTPFLLINGQIYPGPRDYNSLDQIVRLITLGKRQFTYCPPLVIDPHKEYIAKLHTEKGDVYIQLYPDKAPLAVNSFVFLARQGWFDDIAFHRVIAGFVAQSGDPSGTGKGNPGYFFRNEIDLSLTFDRPGVVGMANSGADTNGSQFFITYASAPHLDGKYTIFGQVLSGMDVLENLSPRGDPQPGVNLAPGDKLINVTIEEK